MEKFAAVNEIYAEFFPGDKPARFCIQCGLVNLTRWVKSPQCAYHGEAAMKLSSHLPYADAPVVVLISGVGGSGGYWLPQLAVLDQGIR